jgi:hypothetical protein
LWRRFRLAGPPRRECFLLERVANHLVLAELGGEVLSAPRPLHLALALLAGAVEVAGGAIGFGDDGIGLESVTQHDVGVHGGDIEMVDEGSVGTERVVAKFFKLPLDFVLDLVVVLDVFDRNRLATFLLESELQSVVEVVDELQRGKGRVRFVRKNRRKEGRKRTP